MQVRRRHTRLSTRTLPPGRERERLWLADLAQLPTGEMEGCCLITSSSGCQNRIRPPSPRISEPEGAVGSI